MNAYKDYKRVKQRKTARQFRTAKIMLDIVEKIERSNYAENPVLLNALMVLSKQLKS
jgi:hypothetical protein